MNSAIKSKILNNECKEDPNIFNLYTKRSRIIIENDVAEYSEFDYPPLKIIKTDIFSVPNYWISLGLRKSQCAAPVLVCPTYETIYQDIKHRNSIFFAKFDTTPVDVPIWSIDGTCATGKSSSLSNMFKTNTHLNIFGINTHPYSSIGYYYSSLKMLSEKARVSNIVADRTPYNNLYPWISIWQMIALIEKEKYTKSRNSYTTEFNTEEYNLIPNIFNDYLLNKFRDFLDIYPDYVYTEFVSTTKTILVVDSNENKVKARLASRNENSDLERSKWMCYITLQNFAYAYMALKFPENFIIIDLNRYDGQITSVQNVINEITRKIPIAKTDTVNFQTLEPSKPIALTVKTFEKLEHIRPMRYTKFFSSMKNIDGIIE